MVKHKTKTILTKKKSDLILKYALKSDIKTKAKKKRGRPLSKFEEEKDSIPLYQHRFHMF